MERDGGGGAGGVEIKHSHEMGYPGADHWYERLDHHLLRQSRRTSHLRPNRPEDGRHPGPARQPDRPVRLIDVQLRDCNILVHQIAFH